MAVIALEEEADDWEQSAGTLGAGFWGFGLRL